MTRKSTPGRLARVLPVSARMRSVGAPTVQCHRQRADVPTDRPQEADLPGSLIQVIEQPRRQQREQRGPARVYQRAELPGLEVDITGKVLEPLCAEASLVLCPPHL